MKLRDEQLTMWDAILPESLRALPTELAIIDELLDDERFLQPFVKEGKHSFKVIFVDYQVDTPQFYNMNGFAPNIWPGTTPDLTISGPDLMGQPIPVWMLWRNQ